MGCSSKATHVHSLTSTHAVEFHFGIYVCGWPCDSQVSHHLQLGSHPLHIAAIQGSADVVKLLVRKGADVNVTDNEGK